MKQLELDQMVALEGGGLTACEAAVVYSCAMAGALMGVVSFGFGFYFGIGCGILAEAYEVCVD